MGASWDVKRMCLRGYEFHIISYEFHVNFIDFNGSSGFNGTSWTTIWWDWIFAGLISRWHHTHLLMNCHQASSNGWLKQVCLSKYPSACWWSHTLFGDLFVVLLIFYCLISTPSTPIQDSFSTTDFRPVCNLSRPKPRSTPAVAEDIEVKKGVKSARVPPKVGDSQGLGFWSIRIPSVDGAVAESAGLSTNGPKPVLYIIYWISWVPEFRITFLIISDSVYIHKLGLFPSVNKLGCVFFSGSYSPLQDSKKGIQRLTPRVISAQNVCFKWWEKCTELFVLGYTWLLYIYIHKLGFMVLLIYTVYIYIYQYNVFNY